MTTVTDPRHFRVAAGGTDSFATAEAQIFEVTPSGNAVTLEDEMMKVTSNQLDYQAATTLYARSIKLIRTALGRAG
jgi:flagellar basal-body rod protein FlgB